MIIVNFTSWKCFYAILILHWKFQILFTNDANKFKAEKSSLNLNYFIINQMFLILNTHFLRHLYIFYCINLIFVKEIKNSLINDFCSNFFSNLSVIWISIIKENCINSNWHFEFSRPINYHFLYYYYFILLENTEINYFDYYFH